MTEKKMDLRIEKTHRALHQAFTSLLEEKKFEDFTVNELCQRAMIRRTTFYKHFADKYEYFDFYIHELSASFHADISPEMEDDTLHTYFVYMSKKMFQFIESNDRLVRHILESNLFPLLLNLLSENIRNQVLCKLKGSAEFQHADAGTLEIMSAFYAGGLTNAFLLNLSGNLNVSQEKLIETISDIFKS